YVVGISGWSPTLSALVTYQLSLLGFIQEQALPLSIGPGPASRIQPLTVSPSVLLDSPVLTGSSSSVASTSAGRQDLGTIPSEVLLAVTAGPVGGSGSSSHSLPASDLAERSLAH